MAASLLREVFAEPLPLMDGAAAAGEPLAVLPVLFHLLWSHELAVDVSVPLHSGSPVSPGAAVPADPPRGEIGGGRAR